MALIIMAMKVEVIMVGLMGVNVTLMLEVVVGRLTIMDFIMVEMLE